MIAPFGMLLALIASGVPVLNSGSAPVRATLDVQSQGALRERLVVREYGDGSAVPVRFYDRDMTKKLHLIAVDDALHDFMHVHPLLQRDGALVLTLAFAHAGRWHLYADGMPHNFGRQVFRFDLDVPDIGVAGQPRPPHDSRYHASLDRTTLQAGKLTMVHVHVTRDGKPARDLRPYLGARAHAVVIGGDLSYLHVHAMGMNATPPGRASAAATMAPMQMPAVVPSDDPCNQDAELGMSMVELPPNAHVAPDMMLMLQPGKPGKYMLWLQFRGAAGVVTKHFVLNVV